MRLIEGAASVDAQIVRATSDLARCLWERGQTKYAVPIVVEVRKLENFYDAEEYHQKYLDKNPGGYCHISPALMKLGK